MSCTSAKCKPTVKLLALDATRYLTSDALVAGYMAAVLKVANALGVRLTAKKSQRTPAASVWRSRLFDPRPCATFPD